MYDDIQKIQHRFDILQIYNNHLEKEKIKN